MEAFIVIPTQAPHIPEIFAEAGKGSKGKDWFTKFIDRLPEDISEDLKAHSIYLSDLKKNGKLLFAGVTEDFEGATIVYAAESLEEARDLCEKDPFFKKGIFTAYQIKALHHLI